MKSLSILLLACFLSINFLHVSAQYNKVAGKNMAQPSKAESEEDLLDMNSSGYEFDGDQEKVDGKAFKRDEYGNAAGSQFDLAVDGAFSGKTILVLHLYTGEGFDFAEPKAALEQKGFTIYRYLNQPPSPEELKESLDKSCQLWIISDQHQKLNDEHVEVIKEFWESGKGVYIFGDNQPYYADANFVSEALIGVKMYGNVMGDQTVYVQNDENKNGIIRNHLISTGISNMYEGITIATIEENRTLQPLIYGSAGNLVAAIYDEGGKRLILDGGFTRLYYKWNTAGTDRYVKNAAAWLVNVERFSDSQVIFAE